ncbi:MAG: dihydrodipicolinate synthase family protein [Candidatus Eremiobacteraeota bacterium]|nr:dihydrodipicolinate synthase family protein [Candidatus Eremiobacteraeota bacterium]
MIAGIWSAVLTPADEGFGPDPSRAIPYYAELLQRGCDGLNLLGTTGEAMSFSADQRLRFMEALASSGIAKDRMMAGTGAASLGDAIRLTRAAFDCGFAAALVMPPFFFREASDAGVIAFFDALIARTSPPCGRVLLYNFPRMSGIAFRPALVDRLVAEFPGVIAGMKDSSNDAKLQAEVLARHPNFAVFPGSESDLLEALGRGVRGCISGSVALWPQLAQAVLRDGDSAQARELTDRRATLDGLPFIPAMRYLVARSLNDPAWERAMPPQRRLTADESGALRSQRVCR